MKILHLTLKKKWFDLIASGEKTEEYRECKPYWAKRLKNQVGYKQFDEIHFKNGYGKDVPFMRVEFRGIVQRIMLGKGVFVIRLGKIFEIKY